MFESLIIQILTFICLSIPLCNSNNKQQNLSNKVFLSLNKTHPLKINPHHACTVPWTMKHAHLCEFDQRYSGAVYEAPFYSESYGLNISVRCRLVLTWVSSLCGVSTCQRPHFQGILLEKNKLLSYMHMCALVTHIFDLSFSTDLLSCSLRFSDLLT